MPSIPERSGFLGRKVNKTGLAIGDEYIEAVKNWKTPATTKENKKKFWVLQTTIDFSLMAMLRWQPPLTGSQERSRMCGGKNSKTLFPI